MRVKPSKTRKQRLLQNNHSSQSKPIQKSSNLSFQRGSNARSKNTTIFVKLSFEFRAITNENDRKSGLFKILSIVRLFCMCASEAFCYFMLVFQKCVHFGIEQFRFKGF